MRKFITLISLALAVPVLLTVACGGGGEDNKDLARRFWTDLWNRHTTAAYNELFDVNFARHDPATPDVTTFDSFRLLVDATLVAFPDIEGTIEEITADGDLVMTRFTLRGTHKAEFFGIPATDKQFQISGHATDRIKDGKIVERWENWHQFGLLQQLGVLPSS